MYPLSLLSSKTTLDKEELSNYRPILNLSVISKNNMNNVL